MTHVLTSQVEQQQLCIAVKYWLKILHVLPNDCIKRWAAPWRCSSLVKQWNARFFAVFLSASFFKFRRSAHLYTCQWFYNWPRLTFFWPPLSAFAVCSCQRGVCSLVGVASALSARSLWAFLPRSAAAPSSPSPSPTPRSCRSSSTSPSQVPPLPLALCHNSWRLSSLLLTLSMLQSAVDPSGGAAAQPVGIEEEKKKEEEKVFSVRLSPAKGTFTRTKKPIK